MSLVLLSTVIHVYMCIHVQRMYTYYSLNKSIPEEISDIDQQTVITEDGAK